MNQMVDWDLAVRMGTRLAGEGPSVSRAEADAAVAELRAGASRSTGLVREFTGLDAGGADPTGGSGDAAPLLVVGRDGWVQANADGFSRIIDPLVTKLTEKKGQPSGLTAAVGSRVTGTEIGVLLGFLGARVLGQFDPFHEPAGRLLLVAPNIVHVERELGADPHDFRLWVCLHEETHRVQFTAVPWMREHLFAQMQALVDTVEPSVAFEDLLRRLVQAVRSGERPGGGGGGLLELVGTPEQQAILDRVTGLMSLLEGHADVVMDGVGPEVIPSVRDIRRAFDERRQGIGPLDKLLRRVLGLEAKMAQYRDGAAFVRAVVDKVGMAEFNAVWAAPEHLPSKAEIHDPDAWVSRVLG